MGLYINWQNGEIGSKKKLAEQLGAVECTPAEAWQTFIETPQTKAVLCWVDNGYFDALGYAYSSQELEAMLWPGDGRRKQLYIVDKAVAETHAK